MKTELSERLISLRAAAARRPHATHARYVAGCKCMLCRAAHSRYNLERQRLKKDGGWNGLVPTTKARNHILELQAQGVGYKAIAAASSISSNIVFGILKGSRPRMRANAEQRLLGVDRSAVSDGALVDSKNALALIQELLRDGYSRAQLARWMAYKVPKLQWMYRKPCVLTARTAMRIERLYRMIHQGKFQRC